MGSDMMRGLQERLFKEKVKNFELWKQKTYDALKRHAQTLFADAVQRLKEYAKRNVIVTCRS